MLKKILLVLLILLPSALYLYIVSRDAKTAPPRTEQSIQNELPTNQAQQNHQSTEH